MQHTDTQKEKPTGRANNPAGHTDATNVPDTADTGKAFASLAARFALAGHSLVRTDAGSYYAMRWGMIRPLVDLDDARRFLAQIGGGK